MPEPCHRGRRGNTNRSVYYFLLYITTRFPSSCFPPQSGTQSSPRSSPPSASPRSCGQHTALHDDHPRRQVHPGGASVCAQKVTRQPQQHWQARPAHCESPCHASLPCHAMPHHAMHRQPYTGPYRPRDGSADQPPRSQHTRSRITRKTSRSSSWISNRATPPVCTRMRATVSQHGWARPNSSSSRPVRRAPRP